MGLYLKCSTRDSPPHCRETPWLISTLNVAIVTGLGLPPSVTFSVRAQPLAALVERSVMAKVVSRASFNHLHPPPCAVVKDWLLTLHIEPGCAGHNGTAAYGPPHLALVVAVVFQTHVENLKMVLACKEKVDRAEITRRKEMNMREI